MDQAITFLCTRAAGGKPFMLFLPFGLPHCPFTCPQPWYDLYDPDALPPMRPADLPNLPSFHRLIRQYRRIEELVDRPGDVSELYDLVGDPLELKNRHGQPRYAAVQRQLERRLLDWYIHTSDVVPFARDPRGFPQPLPQDGVTQSILM